MKITIDGIILQAFVFLGAIKSAVKLRGYQKHDLQMKNVPQ